MMQQGVLHDDKEITCSFFSHPVEMERSNENKMLRQSIAAL